MEYHSPNRPEINHRPAYLAPSGKPIAPIPPLHIIPLPQEGDGPQMLEVGVFLLYESFSARWHSIDIPLADLTQWISRWWEDPEKVLREDLQYTYEPQTTRAPPRLASDPPLRHSGPHVTLADLGLSRD